MLKMTEYAKRRKALMQKIGPADVVILPAAAETPRNGDATYPFRQQSDFYYLTGFEEPEAVLVLAPNRQEGEYILFNRKRDRNEEIWYGHRVGQENACKEYLADQSFPIDELTQWLPELLLGREAIHYPLGTNERFEKTLLTALRTVRNKIRGGAKVPTAFIDIMPTIHEMRLFKSPAEIAVIQKAVDISAKGHIRAMQTCKPGMYEFELEAELLYEFQHAGSRSPAYASIVGGGKNACVLHYISNQEVIADGDLVLIDAGAEYQNYAADITRTFPANGHFTGEQRAIYDIVLESQRLAIDTIKPGVPWTRAQAVILEVLTQGLLDLGLLKGSREELIEKQAYLPFYMHRSGHWLGLDVHDVGQYHLNHKWRALEPNMVLTVEPGLYISADIPSIPKRWQNIGVRIEDDILVTEQGNVVLSAAIPKTITEIETLMAK